MPDEFVKKAFPYTNDECPVKIDELECLELNHYDFEGKTQNGYLIVHTSLADEVKEIFQTLFNEKFPIHSIKPVHEFKYDDDASMEANNTSAFNNRKVTGQQNFFSQHSFGRAIDINPVLNPYVKKSKDLILPKNGEAERTNSAGRIAKNSNIYSLFKKKGWDWGGDWNDLQDYQHFEKRANGDKRNPNGYLF